MDKKTINHILNILRQGTITWEGRNECLKKFSKKINTGKFKNGKIRFKTKVQCQECLEWFNKSDIEVDHLEEVGQFKGNFHAYILKMYCDVNNLRPLCTPCHDVKTSGFNSTLVHKRKAFKEL